MVVPGTTDRPFVRTLQGSHGDLLESMSADELRAYLRAIQSFSTAILSHLDLQPLLEEVVRSLRSVLHVDTASVALAVLPGGSLVTRASVGFPHTSTAEDEIRLGEGIAGTVAIRGDAVAIDEMEAVESRPRLRSVRSMMLAPILHGDGLLGLIEVGSFHPRRFSDAELCLLQVIVERTGRAIVNARTHDEIQRRLAEAERVERALADSEARHRILVETAADAIISIGPDSVIATANPAAGSVFGYEAAELVGRSLTDLMPERFRLPHLQGMRRYLETGERRIPWRGIELRGLHRTGREIILDVTFAEHISDEEHLFTGTMRDITRRRRTERILAAQYATSRVLAENRDVADAMPVLLAGIGEAVGWDAGGFWYWDPSSQTLSPVDFWTGTKVSGDELRAVSEAMSVQSGEGLPGRVWSDSTPVWIEDLGTASGFQHLAAFAGLGLRSAVAFPVCVGSDCVGVIEFFSTEPAPRDDELLKAMDALGSDIGQFIRRREAERRTEEHEELQRYFAQISSRLSALSLDFEQTLETLARLAVPRLADWCVVHVRQPDGTLARTGIAHADPALSDIAHRLADLPLPDDPTTPPLHVIETGEPILVPQLDEGRLLEIARDDDERETLRSLGLMSAMVAPLVARNRVVGSITFLSSTGRRRFSEADLSNAVEFARRAGSAVDNANLYKEMEEANRAKAEFLATVSHELRTPLNAIVGYADLLGMGVVTSNPQRAEEYAGRIAIAARHLAELIEEVLAFSRLESGREVVSITRLALGDLLEEIRVIAEPLAQDKQIRLDVHPPAHPVEVVTDARKLRQILLNIVGNAIKFTMEGGVTVDSSVEDGSFLLRVRDTGIGIDPEHIEQIFEPFWQVEQGTTRSIGGTGLGLTVTKRFVDLLGGVMEVTSSPGEGTTIVIRLPIRPR